MRTREQTPWIARGRLPTYTVLTLFVVELAVVAYLLPLFQSSGELLCGCHRAYRLPVATEVAELEAGPTVDLGRDGIRLDGRPLPDEKALADELLTLKRNYHLLHPDDPFPGSYVLAADRDLRAAAVLRALRAAQASGWDHVQYAVEAPDGWPYALPH